MAASYALLRFANWRRVYRRFKTTARRGHKHRLVLVFEIVIAIISIPYFRVYQQGTRRLARRIVRCSHNRQDEERLRAALKEWSRSKTREAEYVQVAGAVFLATVSSCLSSSALLESHWAGPALWYSSIALSVAAIFSGAQQKLVLPEAAYYDTLDWKHMKWISGSFIAWTGHPDELSNLTLFSWQMPLMLLSYTVFTFLAGLCTVVLSPLAGNLRWGDEAKIATVFCIASSVALASWVTPFYQIHRFDPVTVETNRPDETETVTKEIPK